MKKILFYVLAMLMMVVSRESYGQNVELKTLLDSGVVAIQKSNYDKIIEFHEKALPLTEKETVKKDSVLSVVLTRLGTGFYLKGNYSQAVVWYSKAAEIRKSAFGENSLTYAMALQNVGNACLQNGLASQSEQSYLKAIEIVQKNLGKEHLTYGTLLLLLANVYTHNQIRTDKAEQLYVEAKKIIEVKAGTKHPTYAIVLNNLAGLYHKTAKYDKAIPIYKESLELRKNLYGEQHRDYAQTLYNLGNVYALTGQCKEAEFSYLKCLDINKKQDIDEVNVQNIYTLTGLAFSYTLGKQYQKAEEYYIKAYNIYSQSIPKYNFDYAHQRRTFAKFCLLQKNYNKANDLHKEILTSAVAQIEGIYLFLSEPEKKQFNSLIQDYSNEFYTFALQVMLSDAKAATNFDFATSIFANRLLTKGILLHSSQKMKTNILNSQDSSLITLFGQWEKQKQQVIDYEKLSLADKAKNKLNIDSLAEATNSIEKQLSAKSENFATANDKRKYTWQDIQQALKPNEVAVEMVRISKFGVEKVLTDSSDTEYFKQKGFYPKYDRYGLTDTTYYAALLVSKHTKNAPELVILENGNDLENKHLLAYQKGIKEQHSPEGKFPHSPEGEYTAFWAKIANSKTLKSTQGRAKIYFSPDGVYHKINLNTLYNAKTKKYVLDAFDIQQVTNLKEIISTPQKPVTNNKEIVLLGFPNYELENKARYEVAEKQKMARKIKTEVATKIATVLPVSIEKITAEMIGNDSTSIATNRTSNRGEIGKLLQTREEVKTIADLAQKNEWQPALYLENEALEETVKSVNSPRILHIATHGFFNANVEEGKNANPLLRSGLLLAGAAQTLNGKEPITIESLSAKEQTEDGILTAYEVMNLNLDKTDLVVLSACETGLGEVSNGEGVYGLQRAFMVAGAKALIISLWKVDDAATSELMTSFYENYLKTGNKRKAFEQAQQALRKNKDYQNPFYWGAFVMVGE
jgi:CHAT domain-containing protein/TPR repeat protein